MGDREAGRCFGYKKHLRRWKIMREYEPRETWRVCLLFLKREFQFLCKLHFPGHIGVGVKTKTEEQKQTVIFWVDFPYLHQILHMHVGADLLLFLPWPQRRCLEAAMLCSRGSWSRVLLRLQRLVCVLLWSMLSTLLRDHILVKDTPLYLPNQYPGDWFWRGKQINFFKVSF